MGENRVRIINVNKFFGKEHALIDVSFDVEVGEVVMVIGTSGSGKTTLLRCINRLENTTSGEIWIDDELVTGHATDIRKIREDVGMLFQMFHLFSHLNALNNITLALKVVKKMPEKEAIEIAKNLLSRVGLADKADSFPDQLSGGQQQRVAIARALAMNPKVMLFDEPTSALDPEMTKQVMDVIQSLAKDGMTMMVVSHEMGFARVTAHRIVFMDEGEVIEIGTPKRLFNNPSKERTRTFLHHIL